MEQALLQLATPTGLFLVVFGTALGVFVGAIPGLTGTMLIALTLPLTYGADPQSAMTLLISIYVGAISGGMISATLLRMPGTPASIVTTFDGYPMAKNGQPERALGLGVMASVVGGLISWCFLFLLAQPIARFSKEFGPFDYFSLVMMALVMIATIGGKSILRSLFSGFLGILFAMPGITIATGQTRLTFGLTEMNDGFQLLPVLIGMFAVNQILADIINADKDSAVTAIATRGAVIRIKDLSKHGVNLVRSSIVGTWIGLLPGIGANIGSVTAYAVARSSSKTPAEFGTGCEEGIVAAEAANNATVGGALIPLVAMGIPGSVVEAVLLGALIIHGFQPGPRLFENEPTVVYTIIFACLFANLVMAVIMFGSMRWLARLTQVPRLPAARHPDVLCGRKLRVVEPIVRCLGHDRIWAAGIFYGVQKNSAGTLCDWVRFGSDRRREFVGRTDVFQWQLVTRGDGAKISFLSGRRARFVAGADRDHQSARRIRHHRQSVCQRLQAGWVSHSVPPRRNHRDEAGQHRSFWTRGFRTEDWKLVHFLEESFGQLFDLKNDPTEVNNLWSSSAHQTKKHELLAILREWRIRDAYDSSELWKDVR